MYEFLDSSPPKILKTELVEKAYERIESAANGEVYKGNEEFTFNIAVLLLKMVDSKTLMKRFALAEARKAEKEFERGLHYEPEDSIKLIKDNFSMEIMPEGRNFLISIPSYLIRSIQFNEKEWKLVNRPVNAGLVTLSLHHVIRLLRKEVSEFILQKIASTEPVMISSFEPAITKLTSMTKRFKTRTTQSTKFPPCIQHAIAELEKGENLPHAGRFMLATYLLGKGRDIEEIVPLFANAPDFKEKITRYQLTQLKGYGESPRYNCPSCAKLQTQGLCFITKECDGIINPFQFKGKKL